MSASVVVGLSTLLPWLALQILSRRPHGWWSTAPLVGASIVPATLVAAFLAVVILRALWPPARAFPLVALAAGASLGFVAGRMLVGPVWGLAFAARGIAVQVLAFLQVAVAATLGAYASARAAQRGGRLL
jgi:hypothetical protein